MNTVKQYQLDINLPVDDNINSTSVNPVQNKVIYDALYKKETLPLYASASLWSQTIDAPSGQTSNKYIALIKIPLKSSSADYTRRASITFEIFGGAGYNYYGKYYLNYRTDGGTDFETTFTVLSILEYTDGNIFTKNSIIARLETINEQSYIVIYKKYGSTPNRADSFLLDVQNVRTKSTDDNDYKIEVVTNADTSTKHIDYLKTTSYSNSLLLTALPTGTTINTVVVNQ